MTSPQPRLRILVVDDDVLNLNTFRRTFWRAHDVTVAASGAEAIDVLARAPFDAAFIDFSMPGMNGAELVRAMARRHPSVVRFMLTAYPGNEEIELLREDGLVAEVLEKPWFKVDIELALEHALALLGRPDPGEQRAP